ncbi:MAG: hypothetical protein GTN53_01030 [Candidatus Aminicenantes bacterium]|nr:hypothetical protein [Candidatus Aminicenantes bacterium]NIQ65798.1 hypothetical protein [Candidatus Aminicenantes bacterium]NIT21080.1 hypothetical protein [Candidatus Aminicenantes bacterium]
MALNSALAQLERWLSPWKQRILLMVGKAIIKAVKDTDNLQVVQVQLMGNEIKGDIERIQEYGFTSHPPEDSEAVAVAVGGDRSNLLIIATDNSTYRLKLEKGEVALYDMFGQYIKFQKDSKVIFKSDKLRLGSPASDEALVLGDALKSYLDSFFTEVFTAWVVSAGDGGLALKTLFETWSGAHTLDNYLSTKHKTE